MKQSKIQGGEQNLRTGSGDVRRIEAGIEAAARSKQPIDHDTAGRIAARLHSGPTSPLCALASSGVIHEAEYDEDTASVEPGIHEELVQCRRYLDDVDPWIDALETYIKARDDTGPIDGWADLTADPEPNERLRPTTPRIYAASLRDYNHGRLHGTWIDADQDPEELQAEIDAMLARSPHPDAEEWAIHDVEGFGTFRPDEHESLDVVSAVALGITECGLAFAAYASWAGTDENTLRAFDDCFLGSWPSLDAYARDVAEDFGWEAELRKLPEDMQPYVAIDYEAIGRLIECTMTVVDSDGGIHVFGER